MEASRAQERLRLALGCDQEGGARELLGLIRELKSRLDSFGDIDGRSDEFLKLDYSISELEQTQNRNTVKHKEALARAEAEGRVLKQATCHQW